MPKQKKHNNKKFNRWMAELKLHGFVVESGTGRKKNQFFISKNAGKKFHVHSGESCWGHIRDNLRRHYGYKGSTIDLILKH